MLKRISSIIRNNKEGQRMGNGSSKGDTLQQKVTKTASNNGYNNDQQEFQSKEKRYILEAPDYRGEALYISLHTNLQEIPSCIFVDSYNSDNNNHNNNNIKESSSSSSSPSTSRSSSPSPSSNNNESSTINVQQPKINQIITALILDFNKITSIPETITLLPKLKELSLASNLIKDVPDCLVELKDLEILQLGLNPLTSFPNIVCNIQSLTALHLESNDLSSTPKEIQLLINLKTLSFMGNSFKEWPEYLPSQLITLNLSANDIEVIGGDNVLESMKSLAPTLKTLHLTENQLKSIDRSLGELVNLESLFLGCNHINSVPGDVVVRWKALKTFNIPHNNLMDLPPEITLLPLLSVIDVRGNRFLHTRNLPVEVSSFSKFKLEEFIDRVQLQLFHITSMTDDLLGSGSNSSLTVSIDQQQQEGKSTPPLNQDGNNSPPQPTRKESPIIVWQSIIPDLIIDGLYLGCRECSIHKSWLQEHNITHILSVAPFKPLYPSIFKYKVIDIDDVDYANILQYFDDCIQFIDEAIKGGGGVIVHCRAGVSRSATVTIAYLMYIRKLSYTDAFELTCKQRPRICPNNGFRRQLQQFEIELNNNNGNINNGSNNGNNNNTTTTTTNNGQNKL